MDHIAKNLWHETVTTITLFLNNLGGSEDKEILHAKEGVWLDIIVFILFFDEQWKYDKFEIMHFCVVTHLDFCS